MQSRAQLAFPTAIRHRRRFPGRHGATGDPPKSRPCPLFRTTWAADATAGRAGHHDPRGRGPDRPWAGDSRGRRGRPAEAGACGRPGVYFCGATT